MTHDTTPQIRVLVADAQPLFRDGLERAIRRDPGLRLVAVLGDATEVLDAIRRFVPDVAIVDAELDGLRLLTGVAQHGLTTGVALLAADVRPDCALAAVTAGARGYLSKRVNPDIVCDAVRRVAAGGSVLCDEAQTAVTGELRLRHQGERGLLTPREFDVLQLMAAGLHNAEIGRRLHLAPSTVKSHTSMIYQRLGVRDRLSAVVEGLRRGLLD